MESKNDVLPEPLGPASKMTSASRLNVASLVNARKPEISTDLSRVTCPPDAGAAPLLSASGHERPEPRLLRVRGICQHPLGASVVRRGVTATHVSRPCRGRA